MEHAIAKDLPENIMKVINTWMGLCEFAIVYFWEDEHALTFFVVIHYKDQIKCLRIFRLGDKDELSIDCVYKLQQQSRSDETKNNANENINQNNLNISSGMNLFLTFVRPEHTQTLTNVGSLDTVDVYRDDTRYQRLRIFDINNNIIFTCDSINYVKKIEFKHS